MTDEEVREIRTKVLKDDLASINNRLHHAFNQGFELGRKSVTPKQESKTDVLDKIRAEIEGKIIKRPKMDFRYGERDHNEALLDVLDIIDKYRGE